MYTDEITMDTIDIEVQKVNKELQRFNSKIFCEKLSGVTFVKMVINGKIQEMFYGDSKELILAYLLGFHMAAFKAGCVVDTLQKEISKGKDMVALFGTLVANGGSTNGNT